MKKTVIHTIHFPDEAAPISKEAWDKLGHYVVTVPLQKAPDSGPGVNWPKPAESFELMDAASILKHKRALKAAQMRRYRAKKAGK